MRSSEPQGRASILTILFITISCVVLNHFYSDGNNLAWDIFGYYLYLPFVFIYYDLGLENVQVLYDIIDLYHNTGTLYQANHTPNGNWVMKYSMGMAILYLPFFLIGHAFALLSNYPADGFSAPYQTAILIGGMVYTVCGFLLLRSVLLRYFKDNVVALVLLTIYFGTNYFFQSSLHGAASSPHNFLFTLYAAILWLTSKWHNTYRMKYIIILAVVCGLNILARPSEIVCLLIPLLWGITNWASFKDKIGLFWKKRNQIILFSLIVILIGSLQLIYWKVYTGKFLYYSYGANAGEGFEFFHPNIMEVLFSFRKGWLIYTPAILFSLLGMYFLFKKQRQLFYPVLAFFIFNLYIVSSWSNWWYAQSFGSRALVQSLAVMALPFAAFYEYVLSSKRSTKAIVFSLLFVFITLNLFQSWQFERGLIHGSRMTKDYYFAVFGRTEVDEVDKKLLMVDRSFDDTETFTNEEDYILKVLKVLDMESNEDDRETNDVAYSGDHSLLLSSDVEYSPTIQAPYSEITDQDHAWIRPSVMVYLDSNTKAVRADLIICFIHNGYDYKWSKLKIEDLDLVPGSWNHISFDYLTPEVRTVDDELKVFVWLNGEEPVYIDDLKVEVFELKR